ncbi:MAG: hypothetical protein E6G76_17620 [Alphaproteobacteria bacterium]|nr:MAG: hypothetical protein E6G76_17620 [Alphaproteobacteria bacterium]
MRAEERRIAPALTRVEQRTAGDFAIVVVGASCGGIEAMERLFADLPAHIPAAILCASLRPRGGRSLDRPSAAGESPRLGRTWARARARSAAGGAPRLRR